MTTKKNRIKCDNCKSKRVLVSDGLCFDCLLQSGFRICTFCKLKKLYPLEFFEGKAGCKDCRKLRRTLGKSRNCNTCLVYKKAKDFYSANEHKCKTCRGEFNKEPSRYKQRYKLNRIWAINNKQHVQNLQKKWFDKQRLKYISIVGDLNTQPCTNCKQTFPACVMEFDHLPGTVKKFEISRLARYNKWSEQEIKEELTKCELVCLCCHRDRTKKRLIQPNVLTASMRHSKTVREFVESFKKDPCKICNKSFLPWQMDFDHINRNDKLESVSSLMRKRASLSRISEEIAKCQLLCANCHRIKTVANKENAH